MGSPYLNSDESIILSTHNILIDASVSEAILTNRRLILVDSGNTRFQTKEIPFAAIETITTGVSGSDEPALSLAIRAKSGGTKPMQMVFSQQPRSPRDSERDDWAQSLKEQIALLPPGTLPQSVGFDEEDTEDLRKLLGAASSGGPMSGPDKNSPTSGGHNGKASLSSRFNTPASTASNKNMIIGVAAIVIVILLIAGAAFIYPGFMIPKTSVPLPPATPSPAIETTIVPVATPVLTAEPTPVPAVTPEQTAVPQPTAITTPIVQPGVPATGVWVAIGYDGEYTGTIGTGGSLRQVSGVGSRLYQVSAKSTDIIEVAIQKLDTSGMTMNIEVFSNGELVRSKSIMTPRGTLTMTVDLKKAQTPVITPSVTP